jgi:hypothetical protein
MYGGIYIYMCVCVCVYTFLTVLGGVTGQLHTPIALSPRKYSPVPIAQDTE